MGVGGVMSFTQQLAETPSLPHREQWKHSPSARMETGSDLQPAARLSAAQEQTMPQSQCWKLPSASETPGHPGARQPDQSAAADEVTWWYYSTSLYSTCNTGPPRRCHDPLTMRRYYFDFHVGNEGAGKGVELMTEGG